MWDPRPQRPPFSPFAEPIPDPGTDPGDPPFVCVRFNESWRPIVAGALLAVLPPAAWDIDDPALLLGVEERAEQLLHAVGIAERCYMNTVSVTIHAGAASGSSAVVFASAFAAAPVVLVSADNPDVIASSASVTSSGFDAVLTANVPLPADVTANVSYIAAPST